MEKIDPTEYYQNLKSIKYTQDIAIRGIIDKCTYSFYDYKL